MEIAKPMYRLINYSKVPPGQFYYEQVWWGGTKTFGSTPEIASLVNKIVDFRKGNNLPGADKLTVLQDVDAFTCARLNNDKQWVFDTDSPVTGAGVIAQPGGCGGCGAVVT